MLQQLLENELNEADGADDSAAPQPEDPFGEDDLHTGLGLDDMDGGANRPDDDGIGVPLDPPHEDLPPPPAHPSLYDAMDDVRGADDGAFYHTFYWPQPKGGKISWYRAHNRFEATCKRCRRRCVVTRTGNANLEDPMAGRPMGTMAAWMLTDLIFPDEASGCKTHHEYGKWLEENGRDLRVQGRNYLKEFPTAQPFLAKERPKVGGEEDEPRR